jgi:DNA invertase Pin-like site-specific DNA recombinase
MGLLPSVALYDARWHCTCEEQRGRACLQRPQAELQPQAARDAQAMLGKSSSVGAVAKTIGLTRQTIYRIKDDPVGAEAALAAWGM